MSATGDDPRADDPQAPGTSPDFDPTQSMELAWRGQGGDAGAVNELFTRYIPRMRRVVNIKVGSLRTLVDPEEVLQLTLIAANQRLPSLEVRTPSSIYQWLAKIAENTIKDRVEYARAQKRDPARERRIRTVEDSSDSTDSTIVVPSTEPTASQELSLKELEQQRDACLARIEPPDYREVILMADFYESDWETIRAKLGRSSVQAVRELHKRATERLRELLTKVRG